MQNPEANNSDARLDNALAAKEKARKTAVIKEGLHRIKAVQHGAITDRQKFAASTAFTQLALTLEQHEKEWDAKINAKLNERATLSQLRIETNRIEKTIKDTVATIEAYIHKMGLLHPDDLPAILSSATQSSEKITSILLNEKKYPEVVEALKFSLGRTDKKAEAFQTFERHLSSNKKQIRPFIWTVISFMKSSDKVDFAKTYATNKALSAEQTLNFLEEGNKLGAYSPTEMKKVLKDFEDYKEVEKDFENKKEEYAFLYKVVHNFKQEAEALRRKSYGATNAANEMINVKNGVVFLAQLASGATIIGNILANIFEGGTFDIANIKYALNKPTKVAGAVLFATAQKDKIGEFFSSKGNREQTKRNSARKSLDMALNTNPNLEDYLTANNTYAGLKNFKGYGDYIKQVYGKSSSKFPRKMATVNGYETWLNTQIKNNKLPKSTLTSFRNLVLTDEDVADITSSIHTLKIKDKTSFKREMDVINKTS